MNYIKTTIAKADYKKVQPFGKKYLCEFIIAENDDTVMVVQATVDKKPTNAEYEQMMAGVEAHYLPLEKQAKIDCIDAYDKSDAVNSFALMGTPMWLPLEERKNMRQSLIALKAQGIEVFTYWVGTTPITMPVEQFEAIMNAVEVYALQCFNVTAQHKAKVMALEALADVGAYDYTIGYPEKLSF